MASKKTQESLAQFVNSVKKRKAAPPETMTESVERKSKAAQDDLVKARKPTRQETFDRAVDAQVGGSGIVYAQHSDHLVVMEKLLAEMAALRATIASGFDSMVAALLDAAVEEASEPVAPLGGYIPDPPAGSLAATDPVARAAFNAAVPDPPAHDASKQRLEPTHDATLEDVRRALNDFTRDHGLAEASKVVQSLKVKRLTELPAERYGEAVAAFEEAPGNYDDQTDPR